MAGLKDRRAADGLFSGSPVYDREKGVDVHGLQRGTTEIVIWGDSNTYGFDPADPLENRYPERERWTWIFQQMLGTAWTVVPLGMNGRKIPAFPRDEADMRALAGRLSASDVLTVMLGTNDLLSAMKPDAGACAGKMERFLSFLCARMEPDRVFLIAPPPVGRTAGGISEDPFFRACHEENLRMNAAFGKLARRMGIWYADADAWDIPLCADLVHFSAEGHRRFAQCLFRDAQKCLTGSEDGWSART